MKKATLFLAVLLIFTMGCALTDMLSSDPTATPPVISNDGAETPDPTVSTSGAVRNLEDVRKAVIQIVADGTFISPEGLQSTSSGAGSGFIIDPSGIAVTNNHVVAGAGRITVYIGGDTTKSYNAKMLGISECSDLAVIDIEGDGFDYLEWYDGDIAPGLDVYAAGFPLGDPEFTLTRGIVSKARANGETDWASIDSVLEHDATINPGNSGGPLVSADGKVVGVNYASYAEANQYFAIAPDEALPVIEKLQQGNNVDSLGINAQAIYTEDGLMGIWAASVQPGSSADKTGIQGGDILLSLQDLPLAEDGTMSAYCDIIRSHTEYATLNVEVLRYATQEVLAGQINGRELELSFSFAAEGGADVQANSGSDETYTEYVAVYDDYGVIGMEVPVEWDNIDGSPWYGDDGVTVIGASIYAEPSGSGDLPGVYFAAMPITPGSFDSDALLDSSRFDDACDEYLGREPYSDALYTGQYDYYRGCYGNDSVIFVVVAEPEDGSFLTLVYANAVTSADLDAVDHIFNTFEVIGTLPGSASSSSVPSGNGTVQLTVINNSPSEVAYLHVSSVDSDTWGDDRLGNTTIPSGGSYVVSGLVPGYYDIRPSDFDEIGMGTMYNVELTSNSTVYVPGTEAIPDNAVLIMEDYFDDNRYDWYTNDDGNTYVTTPSNGYYCFNIYASDWYDNAYIADPANPTQATMVESAFLVEAGCNVDSADGTCALTFIPTDGEMYMFEISPATQQYSLSYRVNNTWANPNPIDWTYTPYIDPVYDNYVAMMREGGYIYVMVNGVFLDYVVDQSTEVDGYIGIGASGYDESNIQTCYDELSVWRLQ